MSKEEIRVVSANSDSKAVQEIIERERKKKAEAEKAKTDTLAPDNNETSEPNSSEQINNEKREPNTSEQINNEKPELNGETEQSEKKNAKPKAKLRIIAGVVLAAIIAATVFFSSIYPGMKADNAFDEYIGNYQSLLDKGDYDSVSNSADALIKEHEDYLDDNQKSILRGISFFSLGMKMLDYTSYPPEADADKAGEYIELAMYDCPDDIISHDLCDELLSELNNYKEEYSGIHGALTVDHSKFDAEKEATTDDSIGGTAFELSSPPSLDSEDAHFIAVDSGGSYNPGGSANIQWTKPEDLHKEGESASEEEKTEPEEEKPVVNEYNCSGTMDFGFRRKDANQGLTKDNIETIYILDIYTSSTPDEEGVSSEYKAIFLTDQTEGIEIKGADGTGVEGTATYKNGEFIVDFGKGVTLKVSTTKQETKSSGSISKSSGSSSDNKDYSPGSDWEKYDSDSDGKINDKEFQDATNDYMDDYYNEIGEGGNNLDAYDYNNDGEMGTDEFQDAVGDYMDANGY